MEALHADNKHEPKTLGLVRDVFHHETAAPPSFYQKAQQLSEHYAFVENEFNNEQKIVGFAQFHELLDFLLWVNQPIKDVFGDVKTTLHLTKCWDEQDFHLVLTIFSELDDMDELTRQDDRFFELLETYPAIDHALKYVVIAQR